MNQIEFIKKIEEYHAKLNDIARQNDISVLLLATISGKEGTMTTGETSMTQGGIAHSHLMTSLYVSELYSQNN